MGSRRTSKKTSSGAMYPGSPRRRNPQSVSRPLQSLDGIITPNGLFFERYHAGRADVIPHQHRLMIHGMVERPLVLTMDDIMRFPSVSRIHNYSVTGETHNSPSNMEAYGGSLTGIVGIYRDIMGTGKGSRLVAGLYGFCVGPRDYKGPLRPHLHPRRLLDGIVEGVKDGGNKHGVPTPFGNLFFHPSYLGKCLVFVASLGIMPAKINGKPVDLKQPGDGDLIIMCGGRVGKDGIHGVTASSESYSENTPAGHVQIGDPYTQKEDARFSARSARRGTDYLHHRQRGRRPFLVGRRIRAAWPGGQRSRWTGSPQI